MNTEVVIVGGGIAGLATAYELSRQRVSFVVLERASRAGGVILSEEVDGYTIDGGPDSLLTQKPEGIELCEEIGLGPRLVATKPPRVAYIQRAGRLHALPAASVLGIPTRVEPFLRTRLFSWPGKLRMGAELFVPALNDDRDESIGAFMTRRFGREATQYLAEPLLAGIHAGDVDRLSIRALFPRLVRAERTHGSLLRAFRKPNPGSPAPDPDGVFRSLPGGLSEMVRALIGAIGEQHVRTNAGVTAISRAASPSAFAREPSERELRRDKPPMPLDHSRSASPRGFIVETAEGETFGAKALVLATPAYATASLLREWDGELARMCGEIPYASTATVVLAFRRDAVADPLHGSGFVVPRVEGSGILAASWLSSKWPQRAPADRVLLRTFAGGARDPRALERSDAELVQQSLSALGPMLGIAGGPLFTRVYRWERASAQHEVGHLDRMAAIDRLVARHPGLYITGSGFRGVGIPDCIADGRATARHVTQWLAE
jgi:oxygen-dependent protoporphyrinogen oxidase